MDALGVEYDDIGTGIFDALIKSEGIAIYYEKRVLERQAMLPKAHHPNNGIYNLFGIFFSLG